MAPGPPRTAARAPAMRQARRAPTCVVADDHPLVLDAVSELLAAHGLRVVGRAGTGTGAIEAIGRHRPDVAVVDARMPRLDGLAVARRVASDTALVLYTGFDAPALAADALAAGARGVVLKGTPPRHLVDAVRAVLDGGVYIDASLRHLIHPRPGQPPPPVTPREREVLSLVADGLRDRDVSARLSIAPDTVRKHVRSAMSKLGAQTRPQAIGSAIRQELID